MFVKYFVIVLSVCSVGIKEASAAGCKYKLIENGVSELDGNIIVQKHNDFRKLIATGRISGQPRGINLKKLKWDSKLAEQAQIIADSCLFPQTPVKDDRWHVGENSYRKISSGFGKGAEWESTTESWFAENKNYRFGENFTWNNGHYTQMVWADTEFIGCGYSFFETGETFKYQKIYVCKYGPGGNYIGYPPYKTGHSGCEDLC